MGVIYKITTPSNKLYVGKTYDLRKRINAHKCAVKYGKNIMLHNSIRKYGWDAHKLEIIEEVADELMNEREVFWINELKTYCYENKFGLNMTKGGDGQRSTWMHKTELRKYFSDKFSGDGNPFYGKKHSEETRKILSENAKIRNKKDKRTIPEWGAEKGRNIVRKKVLCYNLDGTFNREYNSVSDAANDLKIPPSCISAVCRGERKTTDNYRFIFKTNDTYSIDINAIENTFKRDKRPIYLLNDDLEVVMAFSCSKVASDFLGVPKTTINRSAQYNNLNPIRTGHIFIYQDEYFDELRLVS